MQKTRNSGRRYLQPDPMCRLCHIDLNGVGVVRGGQTLLRDVQLHIHCGQMTALIGQNGAGKTTLVRALLGEVAHSGSIRHINEQGVDIHRLRTGYVPQYLQFDREMPVTVEEAGGARGARAGRSAGTDAHASRTMFRG